MGQAKKRSATDGFGHKVLDEVRFLKNWIDKPLMTGAVAPSSPQLARLMASYVDPERPGMVVELGPGTGVVTQALIERGIAPERIVSIEYNRDFCALLRQRFPRVPFVHGDAYRMGQAIAGHVGEERHPVAAVVSSLPLFTRPLPERTRLLDESFARMEPGAPFIQFSYALVSPVPHGATRFELERSGWVVRNLPPARVWIYRRRG
ncbi:MAG: methyltransferase domain-containing protein [Phyllobacteriaceae bacterium]|nr:methyltransferase domain-containing protein [Phyllobacteriaceae bacterium]